MPTRSAQSAHVSGPDRVIGYGASAVPPLPPKVALGSACTLVAQVPTMCFSRISSCAPDGRELNRRGGLPPSRRTCSRRLSYFGQSPCWVNCCWRESSLIPGTALWQRTGHVSPSGSLAPVMVGRVDLTYRAGVDVACWQQSQGLRQDADVSLLIHTLRDMCGCLVRVWRGCPTASAAMPAGLTG
jgi:hypothetical protein